MVDFASISSVILFAISVFTFITSLITKAQNDGKILEQIDRTQKDIEEIKLALQEKNKDVVSLKIVTESQEQRIGFIEQRCSDLEARVHTIEMKG